jgi:peptidyl-prolyl cis-trans isomerase C
MKLLREPFVHFILVSLALFAAYRFLNPNAERVEQSRRIELTVDDVRALQLAWMAQWKRPPTPEELGGLVDAKVHEEVLYREALALGLDQGDTIVKRRLAQKMEFLADDVSALRDPKADEIRGWFEKNADRFRLPGRIYFRHVYFSPDRRGAKAREAAASALQKVSAAGSDPFMFQDHYADRTPEQVAGIFGAQFAQALFQLKPGAWQGPLESGLGWHIVFVESIAPGRVPAFEEIEPQVKAEWMAGQRAEARSRAFDAMRARYEVVRPK